MALARPLRVNMLTMGRRERRAEGELTMLGILSHLDDEAVALYGGHGPRPPGGAEGLLAATPQVGDYDDPTPRAIEGPFYKPSSPHRSDFREPGETGQIVELTGTVMNRLRVPMVGAIVDLWHANKGGVYDNAGFRYRGHVATDASGRFRFLTVKPGGYGSWEDGTARCVHYHLIVTFPKVWPFTTQFYFPNEPDNVRDDYYRSDLVMKVEQSRDNLSAQYDIVLETFRTPPG
jgi:protocatechuate 3,4-dioxygenase beta subunit